MADALITLAVVGGVIAALLVTAVACACKWKRAKRRAGLALEGEHLTSQVTIDQVVRRESVSGKRGHRPTPLTPGEVRALVWCTALCSSALSFSWL